MSSPNWWIQRYNAGITAYLTFWPYQFSKSLITSSTTAHCIGQTMPVIWRNLLKIKKGTCNESMIIRAEPTFWLPKMECSKEKNGWKYDAHRTAQHAGFNIPLYECAFHWVAHGPCERATHVPLIQFTIALLCFNSVVQQYWATLVKWRYPLLTCSDNSFVGLYIIWIKK